MVEQVNCRQRFFDWIGVGHRFSIVVLCCPIMCPIWLQICFLFEFQIQNIKLSVWITTLRCLWCKIYLALPSTWVYPPFLVFLVLPDRLRCNDLYIFVCHVVLLAIIVSVLIRFTSSDCRFGVFKLYFSLMGQKHFRNSWYCILLY